MGFKILVNDEEVWESDYDAIETSEISISTKAGEAAKLNIGNDMDAISIQVSHRSTTDSNFIDMGVDRQRREEAEKREEASKDAVAEGRAKQAELDAKFEEEGAGSVLPSEEPPLEPGESDTSPDVEPVKEDTQVFS